MWSCTRRRKPPAATPSINATRSMPPVISCMPCTPLRVRRLVLVSSLSVIRPPRTAWECQDEGTPRPSDPRPFGPYTWGKCLQEEVAEREAAALGIAIRIIRPGALVDWHEPALPGVMGRRLFGRWHMGLGRPGLPIPVCDVERCAEAIAWCAANFEKAPPIVNLLDPAIATRGDFVARLRAGGWTGRMLWVPISVVALGLTAARAASSLCRGRRPDGLAVWSILRPRRYETRLAAELLEAAREDARGVLGHRGDGQPGARNGCEQIPGARNRQDTGCPTDMGIHLEWRYSLLTAALLAAIYGMSSVPDLGTTESDPLVLLAQNVAHAPVFAVLTFCWLRALSGGLEISGQASAVAGVASGVCAVLDEWHQSLGAGPACLGRRPVAGRCGHRRDARDRSAHETSRRRGSTISAENVMSWPPRHQGLRHRRRRAPRARDYAFAGRGVECPCWSAKSGRSVWRLRPGTASAMSPIRRPIDLRRPSIGSSRIWSSGNEWTSSFR